MMSYGNTMVAHQHRVMFKCIWLRELKELKETKINLQFDDSENDIKINGNNNNTNNNSKNNDDNKNSDTISKCNLHGLRWYYQWYKIAIFSIKQNI